MAGSFEYALRAKLNRAFAEGVASNKVSPGTANPHAAGTPAAAAWDAGSVHGGPFSAAWAGRHRMAHFPAGTYLTKTADITAANDIDRMTVAVKVRIRSPNLVEQFNAGHQLVIIRDSFVSGFILTLSINRFGIAFTALDLTTFRGTNGQILLPFGLESRNKLFTIHVAFRNTSGGQSLRFFINGVESPISPIFALAGALAVGSTGMGMRIGANDPGTANFLNEIDVGFLYLTMGNSDAHYITDPGKFCALGGSDVDLGANGELPTGSAPLLFMGGGWRSAADWNALTNFGTGGNFDSLTGGPVQDGG